MRLLHLQELIEWHQEQAGELDREQDQEHWAEFHRDAVTLLLALSARIEVRHESR
jgi:hypothetical protein